MSDQQPRPDNLIDLRSRLDYSPDASTLARNRLASTRHYLDMSHLEFAKALSSFIGWTPPPEAVESWETVWDFSGDVIVAAEILAGEAPDASSLPGASPVSVAQLLSERSSGNRWSVRYAFLNLCRASLFKTSSTELPTFAQPGFP